MNILERVGLVRKAELDELQESKSVEMQRLNDQLMLLKEIAYDREVLLRESAESHLQSMSMEDVGWSDASGSAIVTGRQISDVDHFKIVRGSWQAWRFNPQAKRVVSTYTKFVTGRGVRPKSDEILIQDVAERFWDRWDNKLPIFLVESANQFQLDGENFWRFWINTINGDVTIRSVIPEEIKGFITLPGDEDSVVLYKRKWKPKIQQDGDTVAHSGDERTELIPSVDVITDRGMINQRMLEVAIASVKNFDETWLEGSLAPNNEWVSFIFHFKAPTAARRRRGMPTLHSVLYWMKQYKQLLQNRVTLNKARTAYVMDVSVEGDKDEVLAEAQKYRNQPRPGTVKVHSSAVTISYPTPQINAGDAEADLRAVNLQTTAGTDLPEFMVTGNIEHGNFSSAKATKFSFIKMMEAWQDLWQYGYRGMMRVPLYAALAYRDIPLMWEVMIYDKEGNPVPTQRNIFNMLQIKFPRLDDESFTELVTAVTQLVETRMTSKQTGRTILGQDHNTETRLIEQEQGVELAQLMKSQVALSGLSASGSVPSGQHLRSLPRAPATMQDVDPLLQLGSEISMRRTEAELAMATAETGTGKKPLKESVQQESLTQRARRFSQVLSEAELIGGIDSGIFAIAKKNIEKLDA